MNAKPVIEWPAYVWCRALKNKPKNRLSQSGSGPVIEAGKRPPQLTETMADAVVEDGAKLYLDFSPDGLYSRQQAIDWKAKNEKWFADAEAHYLILVEAG